MKLGLSGVSDRARLGAFFGTVLLIHALGWLTLLASATRQPALLGLGLLAYSFGLRHAFDADHIAAIDGTTRKLLRDGQRPLGVGFFFSLGHSTVVLLIAFALGLAVKWVVYGIGNSQLRDAGSLLGTSVSGAFLILIAFANLLVLVETLRAYGRPRDGSPAAAAGDADPALTGGLLARLFGPVFRSVTASWQMYFVGFLFGLGFDTASEVGLLAVSTGAAASRLSVGVVISLPLIFAAGMTLMDTADGAFMSRAYAWAFSNPARKLFYNVTVTALSVFVALLVGSVELGQVAVQLLRLHGGAFDLLASLDLGKVGYVVVAAFGLTWIVAFTAFRVRRAGERWRTSVEG